MLVSTASLVAGTIVYPDSDGEPMADNSVQFRWILLLAGNLAALFRTHTLVVVGGNMFWYPREGEPNTRAAPDVFVVFGRPKGDRKSYRQWEENHVPMTVVFEILSPKNTAEEMIEKFAFYEEHGVEEYYIYNPDKNKLYIFVRRGEVLVRVRPADDLVSPRLGIRFDLSGQELVVRYPDGRPFVPFEEVAANFEEVAADLERIKEAMTQAKQEANQAKQEADLAKQEANQAKQREARLAELTRKVLRQEATPEELLEVQRLLQAQPPSSP